MGTPHPSIREGVWVVPPDGNVTVEEVLLAVGEQVGHGNLSFTLRMNKTVRNVHQLIESGVFIRDVFVWASSSPVSCSLLPTTCWRTSSIDLNLPAGLRW